MDNRNLVLWTVDCAYAPTHALLAKESNSEAQFSTYPTKSISPYGPTAGMLAKELRLSKCCAHPVMEAHAERDLNPYLISRQMLAKEAR